MVYANIEKLCHENKISISRLEKEVGLANGTIGKWRTSSPTVDSVAKVARFFSVTVDELINAGDAQ